MPHLHCYLGNPFLIWGMFTTDLLIGLAYFSISLIIWGIVKQTEIKFSAVAVFFGIFIGACGLTHLIEVWTLWRPDYWVSLFVKFITATASIGTAIYLFRLRHSIVQIAEVAKLAEVRRLDLEALTNTLELRVEERTKQAKENESKFKSLANSIPQLAWMTQADGYIAWYNDRWYNYTGADLEQMQGWGWQHVHHPDFAKKVTDRWVKHLETGEEWEDTFPLRGKDGVPPQIPNYAPFLANNRPPSIGSTCMWQKAS